MIQRLRRLWSGETDGLAAAALIVGAASLASRLMGVFRDLLLASTFGAGASLDTYYAAFRWPDLLYNLLVLGALSAGFIPVFTEYLERKGEGEARALAQRVFSFMGLAMIILSVLLALLMPWLVPIVTHGFSLEQQQTVITLSRIMCLSPVFLGLSAVMGGVLQARRRFIAFAVAPVLYNLGIIIGILFFAPSMGIQGVAWGVVLGALMHCLAQASVAYSLGLRKIVAPSWTDEGLRRIGKLMIPRTAGLAVSQVNLLIILSLASSLPAGSIAVFNLANNIQTLPLGLFGISFAIAAFPKLSQAMAKQDEQTFREAFISAARQILFYVIPITGLFLMLRAQVVRIILGQGAFSWDDTIRTADTLAVLAVSLPFQTLIPLLARGFYAKQDTWKPVIVGIGAELINITLALLLRPYFGIVGLAAAFSVSCTLQCLWLWFSLRKTCHDLDEVSLWRACWKLILATVVMGIIVYPIRQLVGTLYPLRTFWQVFAQGSISALVGLLGFFLVAHLTHLEEYVQLRRTVMQRLWRKSEVKEGVEQAL